MTSAAKPLTCSHCGAALPVPEAGASYVSCDFCGRAHTLLMTAASAPASAEGPRGALPPAVPASPGPAASRRVLFVAMGAAGVTVAVALIGLAIGAGSGPAQSPTRDIRPVHLLAPSTAFAPGDSIVVKLTPTPLDPAGEQRWIALVSAGEPDDAWGTWEMVTPGATSVALTAPEPGAYEIRLHDQYPRLSTHVAARLPITVADRTAPPAVVGPALTARVAQDVRVDFTAPLAGETDESNWITVVPAGSPDDTWGEWHYVNRGARFTTVKSTRPGRFEIRLHDGYPTRTYHVVLRRPLTVTP